MAESTTRRQFIQVSGASAAAASLGGVAAAAPR
ncbi:MAG: twin-arginine translocation signal domain-containing protein, partial [Thermoleophilaceae bacterium]